MEESLQSLKDYYLTEETWIQLGFNFYKVLLLSYY